MSHTSHTTAQKWDKHYADAQLSDTVNPCFVLKQHSNLLPFKGQALELACGLGGNARFLAQCGLKTHAWDISDNALSALNHWAQAHHAPIVPLITDLEQMLLPYQQFDVIVVSRYLDRSLLSALQDALKPNGLLYYQTFLAPVQDNAPSKLEYYIGSGEFNQAWSKLKTLVYGEGWLTHENTPETSPKNTANRHRYAWYVGKKSL
ncbi:class I SAM-dependent methyltransferase [Thiomicrorhabdus aquaedulcis]|uniref:class I SAM-dependent methyltransferase n=1 Tax=Thiomicrorhabdus aquaedulcis TaxID=2211106 RepID=UPI000FDB569D|nr:class I SAM-dependent methyltransferase [Thiomicrorhabdus aquaedulcis]